MVALGVAGCLLACGGSDAGAIDDAAVGTDAPPGEVGAQEDGAGDGRSDAPAPPADAAKDTRGLDAAAETATDGAGSTGLHVEGNRLVDHGATVHLHGVNHSGAEFACASGYAIFDGPTGDALIKPMLDWKVNAVRVPVNEQCWLGINGLDPKYSGDAYRKAVVDEVSSLRAAGLYVIFDLHWAAPSTSLPKGQLPMADADHAPAFWKSAAATFKDDPGVLFDVFNEPFLDKSNADTTDPWSCLQHGCTIHGGTVGGVTYGPYKSAGTQDLLDAVRSTGATNVVLIPGLGYTGDISGWLAHQPTDPTGNTAASLHVYNFGGCKDAACWTGSFEGVSKVVPLITGELGEDDCAHGFIDGYMPWADARGVSYLGWTWNTWDCGKGPALITAYDGTPTGFGLGFRDHLKSL
ncbi:MAG: hypothetical protein NVSMB47_05930 [Polyangiales bacterium]